MPWKQKTAETAIRVRDNQRRSRARRKELLEDLQKRLDEHKRLGVQATLEMQQASRRVTHENEKLRALLRQKGVSEAEVDEYLRAGGPGPDTVDERLVRLDQRTTEAAGGRAGQSTPRVASVAAFLSEDQAQPTIPIAHSYRPNPLSLVSASSEERNSRPAKEVACTPVEAPPALLSCHSSPPPNSLGSDVQCHPGVETLCDIAAAILADMRGHADTSHARELLGCTGPSTCTVRNTRVFELMEEAG